MVQSDRLVQHRVTEVNNAVRAARARRNRYLGGYRSTTKVEMRSHESGRLGGTNLATADRMVYSARSTYGAKCMKRFPPPVRGGSGVGGGSLSVHRFVKNLSTDLRGERFDLYLVAAKTLFVISQSAAIADDTGR